MFLQNPPIKVDFCLYLNMELKMMFNPFKHVDREVIYKCLEEGRLFATIGKISKDQALEWFYWEAAMHWNDVSDDTLIEHAGYIIVDQPESFLEAKELVKLRGFNETITGLVNEMWYDEEEELYMVRYTNTQILTATLN